MGHRHVVTRERADAQRWRERASRDHFGRWFQVALLNLNQQARKLAAEGLEVHPDDADGFSTLNLVGASDQEPFGFGDGGLDSRHTFSKIIRDERPAVGHAAQERVGSREYLSDELKRLNQPTKAPGRVSDQRLLK